MIQPGYPIWNNDAPHIIHTFLESKNWNGKTIIPFCASSGSGIVNSVSNIRGLVSGATWMERRRFASGTSCSAIIDRVNGLGLDIAAGS